MSNVQKLSIALTPEMIGMIKEAVGAGDYTSTSEVVRDALRLWKTQRAGRESEIEELRKLWQEGLSSGAPIAGEAFFEGLRGKLQRQAR
ncbi:type II toxin-antitoxin system ParD family antitoxin [uncultured Rhodoblastus sp.]|uniref:type II toxin-antitoxin system ParD family antitoxin n=1 Tax=uncultured Rhodoblastus sp. TaxID=543037 RepID=UPI0025DABD94|nr:type II toxin-antitoxin system ParD family antitoxin [uncultured Rhodoblastus sp.]